MKVESAASSFPFFPILGLIFITLKLTGVINWSWWWVLSPILIPIGIFLSVFLGVLIAQPFLNKNK